MDEQIPPDTKDWTWAAVRRCDECGFDPTTIANGDIAETLRATAPRWAAALAGAAVRQRPAPQTWSPLEYACHTRDVHTLFADRIARMRASDTPHFADWDGDAVAIEMAYAAQDPEVVAAEMAAAIEHAAGEYEAVTDWSRAGVRGDGHRFTIAGLGHYHLHDVMHHLHDVHG